MRRFLRGSSQGFLTRLKDEGNFNGIANLRLTVAPRPKGRCSIRGAVAGGASRARVFPLAPGAPPHATLRRSLRETRRIKAPDGRIVSWMAGLSAAARGCFSRPLAQESKRSDRSLPRLDTRRKCRRIQYRSVSGDGEAIRPVGIGLDKFHGCDMIMGRVARRDLLFDNPERSACAGKQMLSAQVTPLFIPKRTSLHSLPR